MNDFRALARRRLPSFVFGYLDGGSLAEATLRENEAAWARYKLRQFVLRDVSQLDLSCELFGARAALPLALAPVGFAGLFRRRGEVQAARACEQFGVPFCLSTVGLCSIEEVRAATTRPFWFQLYLLRDRGVVREMLQRAKAAACSVLVFTVDLARVGVRYSDLRHGVAAQPRLATRLKRLFDVAGHPRWAWDVGLRGRPLVFGNLTSFVPSARNPEGFKDWVDSQFDASASWKDIEWLRGQWDGPILLKGILEPDDVKAAAAVGVQGVIVSNHGGRQLDGAAATADVLPRLAAAAPSGMTLLVDGGLRYGSDLLRARALGAHAALLGRPWAWALAAAGEAGVRQVLDMLEREARSSLGLMGMRSLAELNRASLC